MQPPTDPQPTPQPSPAPASTPASGSAPRGEDFDISTLPASSSGDAKKLLPTHWNRAWLVVAGLLTAYCLYFFAYGMGTRAQKPLPLPIQTASATTASPATVTVHVAGAVARPGVYLVNTNARIADAITQAGGATPAADTGALNMADFVRDGAQIVVPARALPTDTQPQTQPATATAPNTLPASPPTAPIPTSSNSSTGLPTPNATTSPSDAAKAAQIDYLRAHPIDLNTATSFELQQLPGIGPARAEAIIAYRSANGLFRSVSDLDNVKGIGEKRMESLKDLVVVR